MASWLRTWFGRGERAKRNAKWRPGKAPRRQHESLEQRELLAADAATQPTPAQAAPNQAAAIAPATPSPSATAAQSAGQTNQQFIDTVYHDFLNRAPDPAADAYWTTFLGASGASETALREEMVAAIMASPEYRRDVVTNIYEDFLHRAPDAAGLAYWTGQMAANGENAVLSRILATPEYEALHGGTRAGLVNGLYTDLLGRSVDAAGQAYWIDQFGNSAAGNGATGLGLYNNGTASLIQQMLNTQEGRLLLLNNSADSALSRLTGQGWNQLFFHGDLNNLEQNQFFAQYQANPSFEQQLQQLLSKAGYYQSPADTVNGAGVNMTNIPLGAGDVPPAGYPMPTNGGANIA